MALRDKKKPEETTSEEVLLSMVMQLRKENRQLASELSSVQKLVRSLRSKMDPRPPVKTGAED